MGCYMCLSLLKFMRPTCFQVYVVEIGRFLKMGEDTSDSSAVDTNIIGNVLTRYPLLIPGDNVSNFHWRCVDHIDRL